jgi:hypothetical protein
MHFSLKMLKRKLDAAFKKRLGEEIASVCLFPSFKPPRSLSGSQLTLECYKHNLDSTQETSKEGIEELHPRTRSKYGSS